MTDPSTNQTRALCEFLSNLTLEQLGEENLLDIHYKTLDWLGCAIAAVDRPCARETLEMNRAAGGNPQASGVGQAERTSTQNAAFYNGLISHALEYDDTNKIAITHPGAPVIAAALAVAEARDTSFAAYALGVAAGYEAMIRMGGAVNPDHYTHWHTTGTCGTFAAAAAAAKIMGLDGAATERAMGIASTMASGLIYVFGTDAKLVTVGNAARNGIVAAELAARGLTAPENAFAGPRAYARSAGGKEDLSFLVPKPGDRLMIEDAYYKIHASCGHTHSALDALQALMAQHTFAAEDVESVEAEVYQTAWELCAEYKTDLETQAKFSLPFCLAVALLRGQCTLSEFAPEVLHSEAVAEYAKRIRVRENADYTKTYPQLRTERITLLLKDGRHLEKSVDLPVGKPPYSFLDQKYASLAGMTVTGECAGEIRETVLSLKNDTPIRAVGDAIRTLRRK